MSGEESHIQLPPDSTGKKARAIKRDDKYEEVTVPVSLDGAIDLGAIWQKLAGSLTYSDTTLTKIIYTRNDDGYITKMDFYAGVTKKFTLTLTRDGNNRITQIERS